LAAARARPASGAARSGKPDEDALLAAWSPAHGYATLVLAGPAAGPDAAARFPSVAAAAAVLGDGP
jgi:hypothetical protein